MWNKCDEMIVRGQLPYNAEPPPSVLARSEITAVDAFYARNHGPFPDIPAEQWTLTVDGLVNNALTVTYDQLTTKFTQHSVVATLACAGNRRAELLKIRPIPGKDPWEHGAISTAQWRGARLADILDTAGVPREDGLHVAFAAPDVAQEARPVQPYGSSIPLSKAMSEEVLLAWQMNGQPLPRAHGGPVRVVVPGYIGARSVKWITAITAQPAPSENYFQALDYRILPPEADPDSVAAGEGISLSTLALNCDILVPTDGDQIPAGTLTIHGYGITGDGHSIERVDVSLDDGHTWQQADLHPAPSRWSWRPWSLTIDVAPGPLNITARVGGHRHHPTRIRRRPVESPRIRQQRLRPHRTEHRLTRLLLTPCTPIPMLMVLVADERGAHVSTAIRTNPNRADVKGDRAAPSQTGEQPSRRDGFA